jgi:CheY-like chemotaxis protein
MDEAQSTVLVVEDNELLRYTLKQMLHRHGLAVLEAGTAEAGLAVFEANPAISIALVDMVLPGRSGLDLAAEIERRRPGFRILYMSGFADSIAMESIARRAPDRVLLKPFAEKLLIDRVRALLNGSGSPPVAAGNGSPHTGLSPFPWDRILEASDRLESATEIVAYRDTAAGFAIAITHIAVLRAAAVAYVFQATGNPPLPIALAVLPDQRAWALHLIASIGLGVDIAPAA